MGCISVETVAAEETPRMAHRRFYEMWPDEWGDMHGGLEVDPESKARAHLWCGRGIGPQSWPDGYGRVTRHPHQFTETYETPRLLMRPRKKGRAPIDCSFYSGLWFISRRFKEMIETIDPEACDMRPVETVMPDGSSGPEYWICSVTRMLQGKDVVDTENSKGLRIIELSTGIVDYQINSTRDLKLKSIPVNIHLFRINVYASDIYCDDAIKDEITERQLTGARFSKLA